MIDLEASASPRVVDNRSARGWGVGSHHHIEAMFSFQSFEIRTVGLDAVLRPRGASTHRHHGISCAHNSQQRELIR